MAKVQVILMVDDEVKAVADAVLAICADIKAKAAIGQYVSDVVAKLSPGLADIANMAADLKADADNRKYLAAALEEAAMVFLLPAPAAPASPVAAQP